MGHRHPIRTILVGGHESADGADLVRLEEVVEGAVAARPGRRFHNAVSAALDRGETVVVVPMTFGRNPTMVADTAKTLRWLAAKHPGRVALSAPFGSIDHLVAWLRTAANEARAADPEAALLVVASRSNPFDEAELHRVAYLAGTHGALEDVVPAIADDDAGIEAAVGRMRRLGVGRVVVAPAGFAATSAAAYGTGELADVEFAGPLMSESAIARVIRTRVHDALHALDDGHDGIDEGLAADHGHGYAHSHAFEESQGGHSHSHGGHSHTHTHTHADGTVHSHDHDGLHAHVSVS
ncbi:sirohydrochlorin chelatase [Agromyces soli]